VQVSPAVSSALERIEERAYDVRRSFTPGAQPIFDDVSRAQTSYPTIDSLSVSPPDDAYFIERSDHGQTRYTRDGSFVFRNGVLCTSTGAPVLGQSRSRNLVELRADPVDLALGRVREPNVSADGTVSYDREVVDPRNGGTETRRVVIGRLVLARFAAGTRLGDDGGGGLGSEKGIEPTLAVPLEHGFGALQPMRRESSGINIDESIDRLRLAYLDFDAVAAAYHARYDQAKSAMDLIK
jgi:flagellar basal body rod protein FlgG